MLKIYRQKAQSSIVIEMTCSMRKESSEGLESFGTCGGLPVDSVGPARVVGVIERLCEPFSRSEICRDDTTQLDDP